MTQPSDQQVCTSGDCWWLTPVGERPHHINLWPTNGRRKKDVSSKPATIILSCLKHGSQPLKIGFWWLLAIQSMENPKHVERIFHPATGHLSSPAAAKWGWPFSVPPGPFTRPFWSKNDKWGPSAAAQKGGKSLSRPRLILCVFFKHSSCWGFWVISPLSTGHDTVSCHNFCISKNFALTILLCIAIAVYYPAHLSYILILSLHQTASCFHPFLIALGAIAAIAPKKRFSVLQTACGSGQVEFSPSK